MTATLSASEAGLVGRSIVPAVATPPPFEAFPKIPRLLGDVVVTEKIDGTNGQLLITDHGDLFVGSRNRWLQPGADNYGFHAWAMAHRQELLELGPGRHYGEWWGSGIQRRYGLEKGDKRFSLFNVSRWRVLGSSPIELLPPHPTAPPQVLGEHEAPACCFVVPILYVGELDTSMIQAVMDRLATHGSKAAPGFMNPEGAMVYHVRASAYLKLPFDPTPKGPQPSEG